MAALKDFEVFISYRHKDNDKAHRLHDVLQTQYDIVSFRDEEELHFGDFRRQLIRSNRRSKYLVLLVTEHTFGRCGEEGDWITKEISLFLRRRKPIIPVLIGGATIPDNLPPAIEGVRKYLPDAIVCPHAEATAMAKFVGDKLRERLRPNWDEKSLADSPSRRRYLSRENVEKNGYFYETATTFRRYAVLALWFALLVLAMTTSQHGLPVALTLIVHTLFVEHRKIFDAERREDLTMIDVVLDRPILPAIGLLFKPLLITLLLSAAITFGGLYLLLQVMQYVPLDLGARDGMEILTQLLPMLVGGAIGVRLLSKLTLATIHFLNSLFGRYPTSLYCFWSLERWNKRLRVIGWVLLAPAVLGVGYLVLRTWGYL